MVRKLCYLTVIVSVMVSPFGTPARATGEEPDRIRGQIVTVEASSIVVKTRDGTTVRLALPNDLTVIKLSKATFTDVDFGVYVGSISKRLDAYSPIVRDSLSWLHLGYELRIFDPRRPVH